MYFLKKFIDYVRGVDENVKSGELEQVELFIMQLNIL